GTGPGHGEPEGPLPSYESLREETFAAYGDMDASPTKAWLLTHADEPGMAKIFNDAFIRRPEWELYDLKHDPHCLTNMAGSPAYADVRAQLAEQLTNELAATGDPRVTADPIPFENPPFTDPPAPRRRNRQPRRGDTREPRPDLQSGWLRPDHLWWLGGRLALPVHSDRGAPSDHRAADAFVDGGFGEDFVHEDV